MTVRRVFGAGNPLPPRKAAARPDVELICRWFRDVISEGVLKMQVNLQDANKYLKSFEGANDIGTKTLTHLTDLHKKLHGEGADLFPKTKRATGSPGERMIMLFCTYGANRRDPMLSIEEVQTVDMYCNEMAFLFATQGLIGRLLLHPAAAVKSLSRRLSSSSIIMERFAMSHGKLFELIASSLTRAWELDAVWLEGKLNDLHDLLLDTEEQKRGAVERFALAQKRILNASYPHARDETDLLSSVYEEMTNSVEKTMGQFYTPRPVVNFMLEKVDPLWQSDRLDYNPNKDHVKLMIDPSCGSGGFCAAYAARAVKKAKETDMLWKSPAKLEVFLKSLVSAVYGLDIDPFACHLTKLNLIMQILPVIKRLGKLGRTDEQTSKFLCEMPVWNIFHADTLSIFGNPDSSLNRQIFYDQARGRRLFDYVIGNPPFVAVRNNKSAFAFLSQSGWGDDKRALKDSTSKLSTVHWFLLMSRKLLSPKGRLLMVAPQSWMQYEQVTNLLLQNMTPSLIYRFPPGIVFTANTDIAILIASGTDIPVDEIKVLSPPPGISSSCEAYLSAYDGDLEIVPLTVNPDCAKELADRTSTNYWGTVNLNNELRSMFKGKPFLSDACEFRYGINSVPKPKFLRNDWNDFLGKDVKAYQHHGVRFLRCVGPEHIGFGACDLSDEFVLVLDDEKKRQRLVESDPLQKYFSTLPQKSIAHQKTESAKLKKEWEEKNYEWSLCSGALKRGIRRVGLLPKDTYLTAPNFLISNGKTALGRWEGLPFALIAWLSSRLRYAYLLFSQNAVTERSKPEKRDQTNETLAVLDPENARPKGPKENGTPLPFDTKESEMAVALELFGREQHRLSELIWEQKDVSKASLDNFVLQGPIEGESAELNLLLLKSAVVHSAIDLLLFEAFGVSPELRSIIERPVSHSGEGYPLMPDCVKRLSESGWMSRFSGALKGRETKPATFAKQMLVGLAELQLRDLPPEVPDTPSRKKPHVAQSPAQSGKGNAEAPKAPATKKKKIEVSDELDPKRPIASSKAGKAQISSKEPKRLKKRDEVKVPTPGGDDPKKLDQAVDFFVTIRKGANEVIFNRERFSGDTLIKIIRDRACKKSQATGNYQLFKQVDNSVIANNVTLQQCFGEPDHVFLILASHPNPSDRGESSLKKLKK